MGRTALCILAMMLIGKAIKGQSCSTCRPLQGGLAFQDCVTADTSIVEREGSTVTVNLTVDIASITFEWLTINRRTYNGKICGPTIRVKKGDTLRLNLVNDLGAEQSAGNHNELRLPNTTNIHLHGFHISSEPPGDDVFTRVDPENSNKYVYTIDAEQPAGTYWYHAHWHGSTWFHVSSGLSGLLIVDDDAMPTELDQVSCPNNCENDIHILMQSTLQYTNNSDGGSFIWNLQREIGDSANFRLPDETESWLMNPDNEFDHYTVNGLFRPQLVILKNQLKRFRLANAGGFSGLELEIVNSETSQPACVIKEIAYDGVYLDTPRNQNNHQTYLAIGARVDWLIYCSEAGTYLLRSWPNENNTYSVGEFRRFNGTLMTIVVQDSSSFTPTFPASLPSRPDFIDDLRNFVVPEENKFTLEFANDFFINRKKFVEKEDYRYQMQVGSVQEWTLISTLLRVPHPIHIHVNHFQVISYNEYSGPVSVKSDTYGTYILRAQNGNVCNDTYSTSSLENEVSKDPGINDEFLKHKQRWEEFESNPDTAVGALGYARSGDWRDVLNLPPLSSVTVRFKVHAYSGAIVAHCHVLKHEDLGMMITVQATNTPVDNSMIRDLNCYEINRSPEQKMQFATQYGFIIMSFSVLLFSFESIVYFIGYC